MGKAIERSNYRVEVEIPEPWSRYDDPAKLHSRRTSDGEDIAKAIRRHVDDIGRVTVTWDSRDVCEHCGATWTEKATQPHNGGCCDEDGIAFDVAEALGEAWGETTGSEVRP